MDTFESHNLLFAYGPLRQGMARGNFLSAHKAKFLEAATIAGALYTFGDFPGLILHAPGEHHATALAQKKNGSAEVQGELFEIFDPLTFFETLDMIEGYWPDQAERSLFIRKLISVHTATGETRAWAYILNLPVADLPRYDTGE